MLTMLLQEILLHSGVVATCLPGGSENLLVICLRPLKGPSQLTVKQYKISLHHAISIILMASNMADTD